MLTSLHHGGRVMIRLSAVAALILLTACAKPPEQIVATTVPDEIYAASDCPTLRRTRAELALALSTLSHQQASAVTGDTVGVIMIGLPLSSMGGNDAAPRIAETKGRIDAVDRAIARKSCPP